MASSAATRRGPAAPPHRGQRAGSERQPHLPAPSQRPVQVTCAPAHVFRCKRSASARFVHPARHTQSNLPVRVRRTLAVRSPRTSLGENTYMGFCTDAPTCLVTGGDILFGILPKYGASRIIDSLLSTLARQRSRIEPQNASEREHSARRSTWARGHVLAGFVRAYVTSGGRAGRLPAPVAPAHLTARAVRPPSISLLLASRLARRVSGTRLAGGPAGEWHHGIYRTLPGGRRLGPASY
ncbi:hypothetical protein TRAPUB_9499 [Trametes pubescens]|uniref:Uncharacterized protein n=1 Tax=Trametes pubescens TaxID=154538 RepID=A0A1M2W2F9_TRAPU|nr:hypothetical protein TRAPUB_9499 [Trametes pubescens]